MPQSAVFIGALVATTGAVAVMMVVAIKSKNVWIVQKPQIVSLALPMSIRQKALSRGDPQRASTRKCLNGAYVKLNRDNGADVSEH